MCKAARKLINYPKLFNNVFQIDFPSDMYILDKLHVSYSNLAI